MKTTLANSSLRATALALSVAGLVFCAPHLSWAAEQTANAPTTSTFGSGKTYKTTVERKSEGQLSAEDLHQASLLSSQLLMHLNTAAERCLDGKGDEAKPEIEKAQTLAGLVRKLLPTTTVTTIVSDAQGKEVYRDVQKVQDDQIPIFSGQVAVEVVEPIVEAKKDQAALKGLKLADADIIHTSMLVDLSYLERKLARATQLLSKPEEAAAQLALAQDIGVRLSLRKEDSPLVEVQHALRLAERMVQEKKYEGAKANLQLAKLRLEAYRGLVGAAEAKPAADLEKEIEKVSSELEKPGVADRIRGMWEKATSWFKRESGQAHQTTPAPESSEKKKESTP